MPPKRRAPQPSTTTTTTTTTPKPRRSALAKEHNITAALEAEILEAFSLFTSSSKITPDSVIPIGDVRRALKALDIPPTKEELPEFLSILDPENEGSATYANFLAIAALKLAARAEDADGERRTQEVEEAFLLFTRGAGERITLQTLKGVARSIGMGEGKGEGEVSEEVLRDMILEANGGAGVQRGVKREEFEGVMKRAGMWR